MREIGEILGETRITEDGDERVVVAAADFEPTPESLPEATLRAHALRRADEPFAPGNLRDRQDERLLVVLERGRLGNLQFDRRQPRLERFASGLHELALPVGVDLADGRWELEDFIDDRRMVGVVQHDLLQRPPCPDALPELHPFAHRLGAGEGRLDVGRDGSRHRYREERNEEC
jgi:hypothetical protein